MKKTWFKAVIAILSASAFFTSCQNNDLYDPNYAKEKYEQNWTETFGKVDPKQDFSSVNAIRANVKVTDDCTLLFFDANPNNKQGEAKCLGLFHAKAGETVKTALDVKKAVSLLYVGTYKDGYMKVYPMTIENGEINKDLTTQQPQKTVKKVLPANAPTFKWTPGQTQSTIPANATAYPFQWNNVQNANYIISSSGEVNSQFPATYYIVGNVTLSKFYSGPNGNKYSKIYILPGSTLTLKGNPNFTEIYIAGKTESSAAGKLRYEQVGLYEVNILNEGELELVGTQDVNNLSHVINRANLTTTGKLHVTNNGQLLNEGEVNAVGIHVDNNGLFINNSNVLSTGETYLTNKANWINNAPWHTRSMKIDSANGFIFNACTLFVEEGLIIDYSSDQIYIDGGCSIITKDLYYNNAKVVLGNGSLFKVTGTASFAGVPTGRGIVGGSTDYAVLQMNKATTINHTGIEYGGKLFVDCSDHFEAGPYGYPYIRTSSEVAMVAEGNAPITINPSTCNPGYNNAPIEIPVVEPAAYIFACEDLGTTNDVDFNDVVFSISHLAGETKAKFQMLAAGGTMKSIIRYNGTIIGEAHELLGSQDYTVMINTKSFGHAGEIIEIDVPADWTIADNKEKFSIEVTGTSDKGTQHSIVVAAPTAGSIPQMLIAPYDWEWPIERTSIQEAYPDFSTWTTNATITDWNLNKKEGATISR